MQNLLSQAENIIKHGVVYSASGDGKIPFIDESLDEARARLTQADHPPG